MMSALNGDTLCLNINFKVGGKKKGKKEKLKRKREENKQLLKRSKSCSSCTTSPCFVKPRVGQVGVVVDLAETGSWCSNHMLSSLIPRCRFPSCALCSSEVVFYTSFLEIHACACPFPSQLFSFFCQVTIFPK